MVWSVNRNRGDRWVLKYATIFSKRPYRVSGVVLYILRVNVKRFNLLQTMIRDKVTPILS